ncbi:MAG: hypothetical protein RDV48_00315 [Candidatus Eremiobacteraeota bacterium]|nr:hypothetical protein [Candidatus Eremiobacteraeota bacterium]
MSSQETIKEFHDRICHFEHPEELFGDLGEDNETRYKTLSNAFKYLVKLYHPDLFPSGSEEQHLAGIVTKLINSLRTDAEKKIEKGTYGQPIDQAHEASECIITTSLREYRVTRHFAEGEKCDIYHAEYDDPEDKILPFKQAVIKIIALPSENHLIENEIQVLRLLTHQSLPQFIDHFIMPEEKKKAVISRFIEGADLTSIRQKYPDGVPDRHVCWIMERLLSVLGFMHYNAVLHCNIHPGNIIVRPRDHNVFLIDFLHSLVHPDGSDKMKAAHKDFAAPELTSFASKAKPHPAADMYALGKSMIYLLGGDARGDTVPHHVDRRIARFIKEFLTKNPVQRANDAWNMYGRISDLRLEVFGARHEFYPFAL